MCPRLEAQLATIDRGGSGDPAKDDQIRRYQDAAAKQQGELDRVTSQAKRMGCDSSGFFSLFNGQSAQCGPVNTQIQQMRANLDQITNSLERLRGGGRRRRSRQPAPLGADGAGAEQLRPAIRRRAAHGPGNFLDNLFGNNNGNAIRLPGADIGPQSGTYRTVCVRTCDGVYFPISFATVPGRFPDDEKTCKALCPAAEATLFAYRNPGEDMNQAVSINGQPYSSLPNAFRFRQEFNPSCSCKAAGPDLVRRAEEPSTTRPPPNSRATSSSPKRARRRCRGAPQAKPAPGRGQEGRRHAAPRLPPAAPPDRRPAARRDRPALPSNKPIRSVGPTFIPAR